MCVGSETTTGRRRESLSSAAPLIVSCLTPGSCSGTHECPCVSDQAESSGPSEEQ